MRNLGNTIRFGLKNSSADKQIQVETSGAGQAMLTFRGSDQSWVLVNPNGVENPIQYAVISTNRVWVSKSGNDATALVNREDRPFLSFQAAINAIKTQGNGQWDIIGRLGNYDEALQMTAATTTITYNLHLDDGCNIIYTGSLPSVIGGTPGQVGSGVTTVNIYGKGSIRNQGGAGGNAVGENNPFANGFMQVNVYSAKDIRSNNYALTGFVGEVQNVELYGFVNAINLTLGFSLVGGLTIKNAQVSSNGDAIKVTSLPLVSVQNSVIESLTGKGVTCQGVNQILVEECQLQTELEAIESQDKYNLWALHNKLILSRTSDAIKIGDAINRNDTTQSKIHYNHIICGDASKEILKAGAGQNVQATIKFNSSNVSFQTGGQPGRIRSWGTDYNSIHQNITS